MRIGVLALQGDFHKHGEHLKRLGLDPVYVRTRDDILSMDGLIIPGGESTTIGKLLVDFGLDASLKERLDQGLPVFGTCAGMILMAKEIVGREQFKLNLLDISVERNAYGRQIDSFEAEFEHSLPLQGPLHGVFIRAPRIAKVGPDVRVLARFEDCPVLVQQEKYLAASFHPELTENLELHRYFLSLVERAKEEGPAVPTLNDADRGRKTGAP
ncbi:pyridoxal 5'-phosphate synthase glutaminase subunit PdxT [Marispirochaeta aestuarii]|uniref:pyridoxal 5'-phosphate synthase glutaminase subunit PdxT n=1 Tax=Marispirochaeta aestuarii TaxID=1963862 RepID=UPI0029C9341A|nr:pyridoxal 5'-phosphate synthase glutaminase subunit PdxT [Marispirochaeta aestuarii]